MTRTNRQLKRLNKRLPFRYLFRAGILGLFLVFNSWAIAAFVPAYQKNDTGVNALPVSSSISVQKLKIVHINRPETASTALSDSVKSADSNPDKVQKYEVQHTNPVPQSTKKAHEKKQPIEAQASLKPAIQSTPNAVDKKVQDSALASSETAELTSQTREKQNKQANQNNNVPDNLQNKATTSLPLVSEPSFLLPPTPPRYPASARRRGQEGIVWLDIWLNQSGEQTQREITKSSGINALDKAAVEAVSNWQFKPHKQNGYAIASRLRIPIEFVLN